MTTPTPDPVIGAIIVDVRPMTQAELDTEAWEVYPHHVAPIAIVLSTGAILYPSRDEEGNGPGVLFGILPDKSTIMVMPSE